MNVMQRVTIETMKKNRRRTVITMLGTAVAVAMVTAIAVLAASFVQMGRNVAIQDLGEWHIRFHEVDSRALPVLQQHNNLAALDLEYPEAMAQLPGREENTRSALALTGFNTEAFARLPITLTEGRLPEAPGEILLSDNFRETAGMNWAVGDMVELDSGYYEYDYFYEDEDGAATHTETIRGRDHSLVNVRWVSEGPRRFTVVGYGQVGRLEAGWQDAFTAVTVFSPETLVPGQPFDAMLLLRSAGAGVFDEGTALRGQVQEAMGSEEGWYGPDFNTALLGLGGIFSNDGIFTALAGFFAVLLLIVVIGSVSLINNAFSISLAERVRALGMLAGVGATRRQKRSSVFFEAFVIGIFSIPAGILGGLAGIGITLAFMGGPLAQFLSSEVPVVMDVPWWAVAFTVVFSAFILLLSAWLPARRASKISPVEAMRGGGEGEKVRRIRTGRLTRRIFGFEAELGLKNSKRSRRRYLAILSSLVISVVLFLTVSAAMLFIRQSGRFVAADESSYNTRVMLYSSEEDIRTYDDFRAPIEMLRGLPHAGQMDVYQQYYGQMDVLLPEAQLGAAAREEVEVVEGTAHFWVQFFALDDDTFARYCEAAGLAPDILDSAGGQGIPGILLAPLNVRTQSGGWATYSPTTLQAGSSFSMHYGEWHDTQEEYFPGETQLNVAAVSSLFPEFLPNSFSSGQTLPVLTTLRWADTIKSPLDGQRPLLSRSTYNVYSDSGDPAALYSEVEALQLDGDFYTYAYNLEEDRQRDRMGILVLQVFTYGFVTLITLVCAANIFNTVSTGIALRAREFAMLRSVGLTPKGFNRMLDCETLFYGVKALAWGLPLSVLLSLWLYRMLYGAFRFTFVLPWGAYGLVVLGVFALVGLSMLYARRKVRSLNIAETLKNENW